MSLAINLGSPEIASAHDAVRNGTSAFVVYTLTATNDLKVQELGSKEGTLEEMADEFSDGKIQFAFARVTDSTTKLQKFVRVNWCGGGVPTFKKSRFTQLAEGVDRVLLGAHVVIQGRSDADVEPDIILKRIAESGGSKYSTHQEAPQKLERPAPVGSNYKPVGRPDIASMSAKAKPEAPAAVGTSWTPRHTELNDIRAKVQHDKTAGFTPSPPAPQAAAPPPLPAASRPVPNPSFPTSAASQQKEQPKSSYEPPAPVGTAYTPVSIPKAGKLGNRLAAFQAGSTGSDNNTTQALVGSGSAGDSKKLTWSERQAQTKKMQAEEDAASSAAIGAGFPSPPRAPSPPSAPTVPQAPPPPPISFDSRPSTSTLSIDSDGEPARGAAFGAAEAVKSADADKEAEDGAVSRQAEKTNQLRLTGDEAHEAAAIPRPAGESTVEQGKMARVLFEYAAEEGNELDLPEGSIVEQVEQIDEGWWSGMLDGKTGLFPANYVELIEDAEPLESLPPTRALASPLTPAAPEAPEPTSAPVPPPAPPMPSRPSEPEPQEAELTESTPRATALYEYTADEDNELSFAENDEITELEFSSGDWWTGTCKGSRGLFPANYVQLVE